MHSLFFLYFLAMLAILLASERDTIQWCLIENRGYLFIYVCGRTQVILYFDPGIFCVSSVIDHVQNFTKQNLMVYRSLPIILEIELFIALNSFAGAVKT